MLYGSEGPSALYEHVIALPKPSRKMAAYHLRVNNDTQKWFYFLCARIPSDIATILHKILPS